MFGQKKLFGNTIDPSCSYCKFGTPTGDGEMILCEKRGVVAPYYSCKKYKYAPLKRVPKRRPSLEKRDRSEFDL